jgi:hypothetical protein
MSVEKQNCDASRDACSWGTALYIRSRYVAVATDARSNTRAEAVFSVLSVSRLYNEDQLQLQVGRERGYRQLVKTCSN